MTNAEFEHIFQDYQKRFIKLRVAADNAFEEWRSCPFGTPENDEKQKRYSAAVEAINSLLKEYEVERRKAHEDDNR
jgi:hypothetical protein